LTKPINRDRNFFNASGFAYTVMNCSTWNYANPNWTMGNIYKQTITECGPVSLTIMPQLLEAWSTAGR
jgi:hypothetical protein